MKNLVLASYTPVERGTLSDSESLVGRYLASEFPAFVIEAAGKSLRQAVRRSGVGALLRAAGYEDAKNNVGFDHRTASLLPDGLDKIPYPTGEEWVQVGVTALHTDTHRLDQEPQISLNYTALGSGEVRVHTSRLTPEQLAGNQWEILNEQTGDLLWHSLADPTLIDPAGYKCIIGNGDLLVFDPSNVHMVRSLTIPRLAEATFFQKVA